MFHFLIISFNPLNQVYVFNEMVEVGWSQAELEARFNPLNQVYVFNNIYVVRDVIADDVVF